MNDKCFIVAEIAQAHDGSIGILHSYIDAISKTGVDAIKFQMHIAQAESSPEEPFRVKFSYVDKSRYDYWKRMELSYEQWKEVKRHCDDLGIEFLCTPFSSKAVEQLEKLNVKRYKVGSGDTSNFLLLDKIIKTKKEVFLSTGVSTYEDLDNTTNFLKKNNANYSLLHCTTAYPTKASQIQLLAIPEMRKKYNVRVGFSDHSGEVYPSLGAVALGAKIIEVHTVFDKRMFGPDATSSLTLSQLEEMVKGIRFIEESLTGDGSKGQHPDLATNKKIFGKSLAVNKALSRGHKISIDDLEAKKPEGSGIHSSLYETIIGKELVCNLDAWEFLKKEHLR